MDNKLQELTDKLYREGLSKGKEEGEAILAKANEKATDIISAAQKEAEAILDKARKDARELKKKVEGDVKVAAFQSLQATRTDIENLMLKGMTDGKVGHALADPAFIRKVILAVAERFSSEEAGDLEIILPESLKDEVGPFVKGELADRLGKGITAKFSKKIAGGFNIGPKDGSYFISLTDETFERLIGEYLRPATRKILFGE